MALASSRAASATLAQLLPVSLAKSPVFFPPSYTPVEAGLDTGGLRSLQYVPLPPVQLAAVCSGGGKTAGSK